MLIRNIFTSVNHSHLSVQLGWSRSNAVRFQEFKSGRLDSSLDVIQSFMLLFQEPSTTMSWSMTNRMWNWERPTKRIQKETTED